MSTKIQQIQKVENENNSEKPSSKFDHQFCKDLPQSLSQLSDFLYSEKDSAKGKEPVELVKYPWMPDYTEDINLNNLQIDLNDDNDDDKDDAWSKKKIST